MQHAEMLYKSLCNYVAAVCIVLTAFLAAEHASAEYRLPYEVSTTAGVSTGAFAPSYIMNNNGGVITQGCVVQERGRIIRPLDLGKRFSYSFGADVLAGWQSPARYRRWYQASGSEEEGDGYFAYPRRGVSPVRLQQLYGSVKWRGVYLLAGMKEYDRSIFNQELVVGVITLSNNARPIPMVSVGFVDFQNIPFTRGWVQIQGEIAYGRFIDGDWLRNHYNYYNHFITTGAWFHYKRCYFRTNPGQPFSVTLGMQHAVQFGGNWRSYTRGVFNPALSWDGKMNLRDFIDIFYQGKGGHDKFAPGDDVNFVGNHLGSWDIRLRYRFGSGHELTAYLQKPWDDDSGVAWQTGFDGVWGLEYKAPEPGWVDGAVLEYVDFTHQSGSIHWDPANSPDADIPGKATGADNYYNNFMYNGWSNYGLSVGTPFYKQPIYNRDGILEYKDNLTRGIHAGIKGTPVSSLDYRVLIGWRTAYGTPYRPRTWRKHCVSAMAEASYRLPRITGLSVNAKVGFDAGSLLPPVFGLQASVVYTGDIIFKSRRK